MGDDNEKPITWGLRAAEGTRFHWSARAIYPVDLLWDRMSVVGDATEDERKALGRWLDDKALPYLRSLVREQGGPLRRRATNAPDFPGTGEDREIRISGDGYTLRANPRGSYGYLYLSAAPDPTATGRTPKVPRPRAARRAPARDAQRSRRPAGRSW